MRLLRKILKALGVRAWKDSCWSGKGAYLIEQRDWVTGEYRHIAGGMDYCVGRWTYGENPIAKDMRALGLDNNYGRATLPK